MYVDSGTTMITMPSSDFRSIMHQVFPGRECINLNGNVACSCTHEELLQVPSLYFSAGGKQFEIPSKEWVIYNRDLLKCEVFIGEHGENKWILGLNFIVYYYTVFDYGKNRVGLVENINFRSDDTSSMDNTLFVFPLLGAVAASLAGFIWGKSLFYNNSQQRKPTL